MAAGREEREPEALDVESGEQQGDSQIQAASAGGLHHRHTTATDGSEPPAAGRPATLADAKPMGSTNLSEKAGGASEAASEDIVINSATYWEIAKYFGILGWTAFGGPAAHVAMFQKVRTAEAWARHFGACGGPLKYRAARDVGAVVHGTQQCEFVAGAPAAHLVLRCVRLFLPATVPAPVSDTFRLCRRHLPAVLCGPAALVHLPGVHRASHAGPVHARWELQHGCTCTAFPAACPAACPLPTRMAATSPPKQFSGCKPVRCTPEGCALPPA